jgi:hypothetical protein
MPATGPGDKPNRPRRATRRAPKSQPPSTEALKGRAYGSRPARPLPQPRAQRPVRPARPVAKPRPSSQNAQAYVSQGRAVARDANQTRQKRQTAVHAYDRLTRHQKRARVNEAQRKAKAGNADAVDHAILHIHNSRVAGTKKRDASAQRAFDALDPANTAVKLAQRGLPKEPKETTREGTARLATAIIHPSSVAGAIKAVGAASAYGLKMAHVPKVVQNVPKDAAEIAITTPSSVAKLATTTATHPKKVPGMLAAPYVELAKHPKKFVTEHPVSAALMVAPAARIPGRAAGRVARVAGKQTLERPAASLPHTPLKQARTGSRGVVTRAIQAKLDAKRGAPEMTQAQMQRRVDEFHDFSRQHVQRVAASAAREAKQAKMTKEQAAEHVQGAVADARANQTRRKFAQEFGTAVHVGHADHPQAPKPGTAQHAEFAGRYNKVVNLANRAGTRGEQQAAKGKAQTIRDRYHMESSGGRVRPKQVKAVMTPRNPKAGHLFESRADAELVAEKLNAKETSIKRGAHGLHQASRRNTEVPLEFQVVDAGRGQFAVVPKAAAERLNKQRAVGTSPAAGARYMRTAGRSFRGAVLPLSARWLVGQVGEAGFRSLVAGAGPADLFRLRRVVKAMNAERKGAGDEFLARIHGGQFDVTGTAREFAHDKRTLAEELQGTAMEDVAHAATRAGKALPLRKLRAGWNQYTNVVFNVVNGSIETTARKAMAGQAIRQGVLMQKHIVGLSDKAIQDAAKGLRGTDSQVRVAREVDRMYGQYQKFSPEKREHLLHTTPFYPWYRNMAEFLIRTLPGDHPVKAALVADLDAATEEWRKAHGLSLRQKGGKPGFLLGTYPVGTKGQTVPAGRYLPFMPGQPLQAVGDLFLPQYANVQDILKGKDWKGTDIKGGTAGISKELAKSIVEAHVPGAGQVDQVLSSPEGAKKGAVRLVNPLPKTRVKPKKKRRGKRRSRKPSSLPLGGGSAGKLPLGSGSSAKLPLGG